MPKVNVASPQHELPALLTLVDRFAEEMAAKLKQKYDEGWRGWNLMDPDSVFEAMRMQIAKGDFDPVDLANFAAFYWNVKP